MPDEIKVNRPMSQPASMAPMPEDGGQGSSKTPWLVLGVVVAVIIVLGALFRDKLFGGKPSEGQKMVQQSAGKPSGYQAVFLTNGQVYFGKVANTESAYATLTDIYYLQVVQPPLQGQQPPGQPAPAPQPQISLVKLGQELHGPVDEMKINREHILFYEDLKEEGQVVQAIKNYKANPAGAPPPAQ